MIGWMLTKIEKFLVRCMLKQLQYCQDPIANQRQLVALKLRQRRKEKLYSLSRCIWSKRTSAHQQHLALYHPRASFWSLEYGWKCCSDWMIGESHRLRFFLDHMTFWCFLAFYDRPWSSWRTQSWNCWKFHGNRRGFLTRLSCWITFYHFFLFRSSFFRLFIYRLNSQTFLCHTDL